MLINLFIQDLRREDGISKACLDLKKHVNVAAYEAFLNDECHIHFKWYTSQETKEMQWRDLNSPEKIRLFKKIDFPKYFSAIPNASALQDIWKEFWRLIIELGKEEVDSSELQSDAKNWGKMCSICGLALVLSVCGYLPLCCVIYSCMHICGFVAVYLSCAHFCKFRLYSRLIFSQVLS